MKKILATFVMMALMAIVLPLTTNAQTKRYKQRANASQTYKKPSVYQRHRNAINIGVGTGAGALIGAIAGGKRGALLGAAIGGGGAAVYSYGIKPKNKTTRYYRR